MAKKANQDFDADFWLHVATDSLHRFAEQGGRVDVVVMDGSIVITLPGVTPDDERIHGNFAEMFEAVQP
jgi:hypothetical protein